jgi:lycopene beta-cyclase
MPNSMEKTFDIILAGGGNAALTFASMLYKYPFLAEKTVLILDQDSKSTNDRTWCYWDTEEENMPKISYRNWPNIIFKGKDFFKKIELPPMKYNMVRGIDFYNWANDLIEKNNKISVIKAKVISTSENGVISTSVGDFFAKEYIFKSYFNWQELEIPSTYNYLYQHFKGWIIHCENEDFDTETVTFMDFSIPQNGKTQFVYVLPLDSKKILVEYTLFSDRLLEGKEYDDVLIEYLNKLLKGKTYAIEDQEFGVIPMTSFPFSAKRNGKIIPIGTLAGYVKSSSGYAYKRTQEKIKQLLDSWEKTGSPRPEKTRSHWRFRMYDAILLEVISKNYLSGGEIFEILFRKRPAKQILRFLDEKSNFLEELKIMNSVPKIPFIKAAFDVILSQRF